MSISFLNINQLEKSTTRPDGYKFPARLSTGTKTVDLSTKCSGGTQTTDATNTVHSFTSSGNFIVGGGTTITVEYLVVGGGGDNQVQTGSGGPGIVIIRYVTNQSVTQRLIN
tara:strand:- start:3074 stop:3409 length:336 start_codon:yes stop_codon:yes gene_type:complete